MKGLFKVKLNSITLVIIIASIGINIGCMLLGDKVGLYSTLDYVGIGISALLAGPIEALIVGIVSAFVYAVYSSSAQYALIINFAIDGLSLGILARKGIYRERVTLFMCSVIIGILDAFLSYYTELLNVGYFFNEHVMWIYNLLTNLELPKMIVGVFSNVIITLARAIFAVYAGYVVDKFLKKLNLLDEY